MKLPAMILLPMLLVSPALAQAPHAAPPAAPPEPAITPQVHESAPNEGVPTPPPAAEKDTAAAALPPSTATHSKSAPAASPAQQGPAAQPAQTGYKPLWITALEGRCKLAFCSESRWFAVEPIVEIPVGKSFGVGKSGVAKFINNQDVSVQFNLGLRMWVAYDWMSLAVYLSKSTFPTDATVRVRGTSFQHSSARIKRPYPGLALGFFADTLWIGFDVDELKNGASDGSDRDARFPRNEVISRSLTVNVSIAPVAMFRSGIGTSLSGDSPKTPQNETDGGADADSPSAMAD